MEPSLEVRSFGIVDPPRPNSASTLASLQHKFLSKSVRKRRGEQREGDGGSGRDHGHGQGESKGKMYNDMKRAYVN